MPKSSVLIQSKNSYLLFVKSYAVFYCRMPDTLEAQVKSLLSAQNDLIYNQVSENRTWIINNNILAK